MNSSSRILCSGGSGGERGGRWWGCRQLSCVCVIFFFSSAKNKQEEGGRLQSGLWLPPEYSVDNRLKAEDLSNSTLEDSNMRCGCERDTLTECVFVCVSMCVFRSEYRSVFCSTGTCVCVCAF